MDEIGKDDKEMPMAGSEAKTAESKAEQKKPGSKQYVSEQQDILEALRLVLSGKRSSGLGLDGSGDFKGDRKIVDKDQHSKHKDNIKMEEIHMKPEISEAEDLTYSKQKKAERKKN